MPPSILDAFPYPWSNTEAQQLHQTLIPLNPTVQSAMLIAQKVGIDTTVIDTGQAVAYIWKDILDQAATAGLTRPLVQQMFDRLAASSPARPFLAALLADQPTLSDSEPRSADGAPSFLRDTDDVSDEEALLYRDDLTIQIGRVPRLITTLERLIALAPAVCRLVVDVNGSGQWGTGFRIADDLLLTNWHVLHKPVSGVRATAVTAEFGYEDDGSGGALAATVRRCDVASIVMSRDDDWAIIRAAEPLLDKWPIVKLSEAVPPTLNTVAYIIQHPGGDRKRLGFVRNQVTFFDERVVQYLTDTKEGSSGAPVFDGDGRLIALHRSGGRPQELVGKAPTKKNEGIRISRVVAGLLAQNIIVP